MGRLYLVGIGLSPGDISRSASEAVRNCNRLFCETYTSLVPGLDIADLQRTFGRKVEILGRQMVEDGSPIINALSSGNVALLVPGDPMISTTHISLRVQASRAGHTSGIVHCSSIFSAAMGESCLTATRFGRFATISYLPSAQPYDVLSDNMSRGLHTLFLLDIDSERERFMSIPEALRSLLEVERQKGLGLLGDDTLAIGLARVSLPDQLVKAATIQDLVGTDFGPPPHCVVIPGKLHFAESEALEALIMDRGRSDPSSLRKG